ncbi:restriction endonuclease subunit S [Sphingobacterium wenxiniae]|uniref:Type I restriction enzyme, S subunit n=1 Tax=Sphingobacterium wenxiniae TaxID=683125 RepID=A0A1I6TGT3_9SPHI|nr:restriction endonuclease subunit S [Sphingobacterium wenxiniae]SFS88390.1 type I restriction enzyme, S subunit [Sphingobacterium wenxiniae]
MNYKRLGDYIIEKVEFNEGNKYDLLLGVSNNKYFQKAKTNTIGVDLSKYRVAHHNQFVFNRATTRNGDKISIALRKGETCIVSPSYRIFEVADENILNPDYLLMWFKRPEFDRYARFKSHGSAHEFFDMDEMNDVELPIPSIEKQREIVAQYEAVANKIKVNEAICEKLEATAQALYKHWFVDFEFPNKEGQPYKSSGGAMVYNEELEKEIPEGWEVKSLSDISKQICVGFVGSIYDDYCEKNIGIPLIRTTDLNLSGIDYSNLKYVSKEFHNKNKKSQLTKGDILVARHGSNGMPSIFNLETEANCLNVIIIKPNQKIANSKLLYCFLTSKNSINQIENSVSGSVQDVLNTKSISDMKICFPNNESISIKLGIKLNDIEGFKTLKTFENQNLTQLQSLLLSRLATLEG